MILSRVWLGGLSLFISLVNLSITLGVKSLESNMSLILFTPRCLNSSVDPFLTALNNSFLAETSAITCVICIYSEEISQFQSKLKRKL